MKHFDGFEVVIADRRQTAKVYAARLVGKVRIVTGSKDLLGITVERIHLCGQYWLLPHYRELIVEARMRGHRGSSVPVIG